MPGQTDVDLNRVAARPYRKFPSSSLLSTLEDSRAAAAFSG